jgi:hypothetical protein
VIALWQPVGVAGGTSVRSTIAEELVLSGRAVREVGDLAGLDAARVGAIVLSEPRRLEPRDAAALETYLADGGGVVLLGSVAVLDREGAWRGHGAMERLLGAKLVQLGEDHAQEIVAARRGPISAPLAPRERIRVSFEPGTLGAVADDPELRWRDASAPAAAIRRARGAGRLAWLAVAPERALPDEAARRRLRRVLEAAVAWSSRTPWVEVLAWPKGAAYASVIESGDTDGDVEASWRRALDEAKRDAGLAELRLPTAAGAQQALEPVLRRTLARVDRETGWYATRTDLSRWLRSRSVATASVRRVGPRRLTVEVSNRDRVDLEDLVLRIHLNDAAIEARVVGTQVLQAKAAAQLSPDGQAVDLRLPRLEARASAAYHVEIEPDPGGTREGSKG